MEELPKVPGLKLLTKAALLPSCPSIVMCSIRFQLSCYWWLLQTLIYFLSLDHMAEINLFKLSVGQILKYTQFEILIN